MWITNVKYIRLSTEHFMGISIFIHTHVHTISKDIGINKEKETCLPNKEFIRILNVKEEIWLPNVKGLLIAVKVPSYLQKYDCQRCKI